MGTVQYLRAGFGVVKKKHSESLVRNRHSVMMMKSITCLFVYDFMEYVSCKGEMSVGTVYLL